MKYTQAYRRNLPHWQPPEGTFFVTYRLFDSIPKKKIEELKAAYDKAKSEIDEVCFNSQKQLFETLPEAIQKELISSAKKKKYDESKRYFKAFDDFLDSNLNEPHHLKIPEVAQLNVDALHFYDGKHYDLLAFCIMSNHIHVAFTLKKGSPSLSTVMQRIKSYTGKEGNLLIGEEDRFWEEESYDHIIRPQEFERIIFYIINNPVKARLVKNWKDWKWTYLHPNLQKLFLDCTP